MAERQVFHLTGSELARIIGRHGPEAVDIGVDGRLDLVRVDPDLVIEELPLEPAEEQAAARAVVAAEQEVVEEKAAEKKAVAAEKKTAKESSAKKSK